MRKVIAKQTSGRASQSRQDRSSNQLVWLAGFLHRKDKVDQLFCRMGESHIVVLALGPLFSKVSPEGRVPVADVFGGIVEGEAQISGITFLQLDMDSAQRYFSVNLKALMKSGITTFPI